MIETYKNSIWCSCLKTTISRRSLRNLGLPLLLFDFNNFSFLLDIIENIINTSVSCDKNSHQWQCSIIDMCLRLYHVTSILHCHWREFWSCDTDVYFTYIHFGIILTQFHDNFLRQKYQIELLKFSFNAWDSQVSDYHHFIFTVPLR